MREADTTLDVNDALALLGHAVAVSAGLLEEGFKAIRALEARLFSVCFLVIKHVTEFGRLDVAVKALEKLVGAPCLLIYHVLLHEAHVARVAAESVADSLLDDLFNWGCACGNFLDWFLFSGLENFL